jgi:hypothetical protein
MRHRLGLRAVLVDLMAGVEIKGDEAMIQALADFSKRNASHVKGILNLTIPLSESPMWILGQYQLGLSTESRRPLEDGQRVRYYRLILITGKPPHHLLQCHSLTIWHIHNLARHLFKNFLL